MLSVLITNTAVLPGMGSLTFPFTAGLKAAPINFDSAPTPGTKGARKEILSARRTFVLNEPAIAFRSLLFPIVEIISAAFFWLRMVFSTTGRMLLASGKPSSLSSAINATINLSPRLVGSDTLPVLFS